MRSSQPGKPAGLVPAGLGARDTLRLEAAMRLYGNDMDETTTVLEADLGWIVGWKKDDFIGAEVLRRQKAGRRAAQAGRASRCSTAASRATGIDVYVDGRQAGVVTSGTQTPFLKKAIGMAYVPADRDGRRAPSSRSTSAAGALRAQVVPMPFYKRAVAPSRRARDTRTGMHVRRELLDVSVRSEVHERSRVDPSSTGSEARVGITDYAQKQLGDVVYLELPEVGRDARARATCSAPSSR